jgi:peptide-methionine (R)-S-oxide reductase
MRRRNFLLSGTGIIGAVILEKVLRPIDDVHAGVETFQVVKTEAEWKQTLTPEQFWVLRKHGTERPYTSALNDEHRRGIFLCAGCELGLFRSETKYDSGTGWPSFLAPIDGAIRTSIDHLLIYSRTEVHCSRCGGHLGHVFDDGPAPTGKRYCMNGVALKFEPLPATSVANP